jgi:hypothetical protein
MNTTLKRLIAALTTRFAPAAPTGPRVGVEPPPLAPARRRRTRAHAARPSRLDLPLPDERALHDVRTVTLNADEQSGADAHFESRRLARDRASTSASAGHA